MSLLVPTPVQAAAIPPALTGRDILGTAHTGTGKTAAFGIPLLGRIYSQPGKVALVLAPTRELAAQIFKVLRGMSKGLHLKGSLVVGGESFGRQVNEMDRGVDFIVATPGRLNDHLRERTANLSRVAFLVLDEVDRMLDMGFAPQIREIMRHVPHTRQTLLFSATLPREAAAMAAHFLKNPVRVAIEPDKTVLPNVEVKNLEVNPMEKTNFLISELRAGLGKTLIFTRTQSRTERVSRILGKSGFKVVGLHGGRTQSQRKHALNMFQTGSHPILVATDIAGRGIDVVDIETVVNYDLPNSREDYVHRIGRTGRNGRPGRVLNFVTLQDVDASLILTGQQKASQPKPRVPKGVSQRGYRKRRFR